MDLTDYTFRITLQHHNGYNRNDTTIKMTITSVGKKEETGTFKYEYYVQRCNHFRK